MRDQSLLDEIIRLRKLHLDTSLAAIVEEAAQLLERERRIEAEALIENVKARIHYTQPQKAPARLRGRGLSLSHQACHHQQQARQNECAWSD